MEANITAIFSYRSLYNSWYQNKILVNSGSIFESIHSQFWVVSESFPSRLQIDFNWICIQFHFNPIVKRFRIDCKSKSNCSESILNRFWIGSEPIPVQFCAGFLLIPGRLSNDSEGIAKRFWFNCKAIPIRFQNDSDLISKRFWFDCKAIRNRFQVDTESMPSQLHVNS